MVSVFYLISFLVSCFLICSSMVVDDRYPSLLEIGNTDEQEGGPIDDQLNMVQRSAQYIFPSNRMYDYRDFHPTKRQSFGRKHHWDAFFGRR